MRTIIRSGAIFCAVILVCGFQSFAFAADAKIVEVRDNQLVVEGVKQPQLFGAELQYFRLRGGYEANVPRARVLALWNKALDRMVEAGMNTVSFYIPWDFHEYDEGKFDFTGTADADGDGRADYPSRDVITFFKLIADHGITRIMVRPGPYINAEWGFLGFGAIPEWFHKKFPSSHMRNPYGLTTKLYDYHNADLLKHSGLWFSALNQQVLKNQMGP
ncbi:MAG: beta-galactosidase, partial [Bdellovibrionia bacterium]